MQVGLFTFISWIRTFLFILFCLFSRMEAKQCPHVVVADIDTSSYYAKQTVKVSQVTKGYRKNICSIDNWLHQFTYLKSNFLMLLFSDIRAAPCTKRPRTKCCVAEGTGCKLLEAQTGVLLELKIPLGIFWQIKIVTAMYLHLKKKKKKQLFPRFRTWQDTKRRRRKQIWNWLPNWYCFTKSQLVKCPVLTGKCIADLQTSLIWFFG